MRINLYHNQQIDLNRQLFSEMKVRFAIARTNILKIYLSLYE